MAELTIDVYVRETAPGNFQTMSSYRVPASGKVTFNNTSKTDSLVVDLKGDHDNDDGDSTNDDPLCANNQAVIFPITIPKGGDQKLHICKNFAGGEFLYTAQIGTANKEDPIVIIEKTMAVTLTPLTAAIIAAGVSAVITYFIVKSRPGRTRPQQG